jgi:hypothetical protein
MSRSLQAIEATTIAEAKLAGNSAKCRGPACSLVICNGHSGNGGGYTMSNGMLAKVKNASERTPHPALRSHD